MVGGDAYPYVQATAYEAAATISNPYQSVRFSVLGAGPAAS